MATSQDRRLEREPSPFPKKAKRPPRRQRGDLWATSGDFHRAAVKRRRKLALASKRRNRA